jgi:hypothetical protein
MNAAEKWAQARRREWLQSVAAMARSTRVVVNLTPAETELERELVATVKVLCELVDKLTNGEPLPAYALATALECKYCNQLREPDSEFCAHHADGVQPEDYKAP